MLVVRPGLKSAVTNEVSKSPADKLLCSARPCPPRQHPLLCKGEAVASHELQAEGSQKTTSGQPCGEGSKTRPVWDRSTLTPWAALAELTLCSQMAYLSTQGGRTFLDQVLASFSPLGCSSFNQLPHSGSRWPGHLQPHLASWPTI